ncbi:unnamed protein product [Somion occarium]|uniref:Paired amphipathic helix protein Sin3a n=1 Tax=Somion occarium TaxID=3059160 RepID=A0ABP1DL40_9APHY
MPCGCPIWNYIYDACSSTGLASPSPDPPDYPCKYCQLMTSPVNQPQLAVTDALKYLDEIKEVYKDNPKVYNAFLDIMRDFKSQKMDTSDVIKEVRSLFHDQPGLRAGLNIFLPPGYSIESTTPGHQSKL